MSSNSKYPIYPSQLKQLKSTTKLFADLISNKSGADRISAFKRNDWLAQSLGYKSHSDLVMSAPCRASSDTNDDLFLFADFDEVREAIVDKFSSKLPEVPRFHIEDASTQIAISEYQELVDQAHRETDFEALSKLGCTPGVDDTFYG
ncbi:hypothetical protein QNE38_001384 [Vibrio fluvialis]|uniref:hypothetical protein n=1 Tax=Vibrio fluvialis TaxID=676 RepID=UPI000CEB6831|nr:hypothetical protein [Vibrio fluvialis]AVH30834.1 hypothetical protein AL475_02330 [Vibrio fluvialis]ELV8726383.1 hypothetical protein [Vibrio fluvialis]